MRRRTRLTIPLLALAVWLMAGPARAALVNDYSQTDDVWNQPIAAGHVLIDARSSFAAINWAGGPFAAPAASFAYGLTPRLETGLWSSLVPSALSGGLGFGAIEPYLKYLLPLRVGIVSFGLVGGAQIPTGLSAGVGAADFNAALEGVAICAFTQSWTLDVGLGAGHSFATGAALGHANAALTYAFPHGPQLFGELYTMTSSIAPAVYSEHIGGLWPLGANWTIDLGIAANETAQSFASLTPMVGTTLSP